MQSHSSLTGATELYARKVQATNVLATLGRMRITGSKTAEDNVALEQGLELLDQLLNGQQLFSNAPVTRQLVGEGLAFFAAARALNYEQKDKFEACGILLKQMRLDLAAFKDADPPSGESPSGLENFLSDFARVLQADINIGRARRHVLPTQL